MAINKVVYGNNTLIDITDTTTAAADVVAGKDFYAQDGTKTTGTLVGSYLDQDGAVVLNKGSNQFENDIWYELPEETTFTATYYIMTGIYPFKDDVDFTIFIDYTNSASNALYYLGPVSAAASGMRGGGKQAGNTTIYINGTKYNGSGVSSKIALTHKAGSDIYTTYFSKTGTNRSAVFQSYTGELRIGGYYSNRSDLGFTGTVRRFIVYRQCLNSSEIATLWDGGELVTDKIMILNQEYKDVDIIKAHNQDGEYNNYALVKGSLDIYDNGTYDVTHYASAIVNTPTGGWKKLGEMDLTVSSTSTSAASAGQITLPAAWTSAKIIYVRIRDKAGKRLGYFLGSDSFFINYQIANGSTTNLSSAARFIHRYSTSGVYGCYLGGETTAYGVYANDIASDGTIRIYRRYNSGNSLTINGTYHIEVYTLDYPDGVSPYDI